MQAMEAGGYKKYGPINSIPDSKSGLPVFVGLKNRKVAP